MPCTFEVCFEEGYDIGYMLGQARANAVLTAAEDKFDNVVKVFKHSSKCVMQRNLGKYKKKIVSMSHIFGHSGL